MALDLSPEDIAAIRARADAQGINLDAGVPDVAGAPPPPAAPQYVPPPTAPAQAPPPMRAVPGAPITLPPDAAARAASAANMLPATGPSPTRDTVGYSGGEGAGGLPAAPPVEPLSTTSSGSSVTKGVKLSPETKAARAEAAATQKAANAAEDAGFEQSRQAQYMGGAIAANMQAANAQAQQAEAAKHAETLTRKREHLATMIEDVQNLKVDPDHFWASRTTGQKIAGVLAAMSGGFLQGFRGMSTNEGLKMINEAIDRDIAAQRANIENKRAGVQAKATLYNMTAGAFHDEEERHQAARIAGMAAVQKQIDATIARTSDPLERAKMLQARAAVDRQVALDSARIDEMTQDKVTSHSSTTVQKGGPQQGGVPSDRVVRAPDGKMYMVDSPEAAKKYRENAAVAERLQRNIANAQRLRDLGGQFPGDVGTKLSQKIGEIRKDYLFLNGEKMRASGEEPKAILDRVIGDPSSLLDWHGNVRLQALGQSIGTDLGDQLAISGATPLDAGNIAVQGGKPVYVNTGIPTVPTGKGGRR